MFKGDGRFIHAAAGIAAMLFACGATRSTVAEDIRLATGETLSVKIIEVNDQTVRFVHPVLGELTLPRSAVEILPAASTPPAQQGGATQPAPEGGNAAPATANQPQATTTATAPAEAPPPAPAPAPEPEPKEWKFKFTLGGAMATGNTENANLATKFTAIRETPKMSTAFDAGYFYAESGSTRSENRFTAGVRNEWLNPDSKWFYFADARYDYDEFQSWDQRVGGHVGLGYRFLVPPPWKLNALAGIGAIKEFGSDNDNVRPEALLGIEGEWKINEKQSLKFDSTIFPDLSELGEFRLVNNVAWALVIDAKNKVSLTAGLGHEYQSQVDPGRQHNDLRIFAGIDWEF